jgi:hypothetical protein
MTFLNMKNLKIIIKKALLKFFQFSQKLMIFGMWPKNLDLAKYTKSKIICVLFSIHLKNNFF